MTARRVVVTGAGGFIGRAVVQALLAAGREVALLPRAALSEPRTYFQGAHAVIHLAGIAHRRAPAALHAEINSALPVRLAHIARDAGVQRFVFASSVKAAAEHAETVLTMHDADDPKSDYGRAKRAAEHALATLTEIDCVSLRLPLVHGPGARANFAALVRLAQLPIPLPLGAIENRRSLASLRTAADALVAAACTAGPTGVFYVADTPALSTPDMLSALRVGLGDTRPLHALRFAGPLLRATPWRALALSLEVDAAPFRAGYGIAARDSRTALIETARAWHAA